MSLSAELNILWWEITLDLYAVISSDNVQIMWWPNVALIGLDEYIGWMKIVVENIPGSTSHTWAFWFSYKYYILGSRFVFSS